MTFRLQNARRIEVYGLDIVTVYAIILRHPNAVLDQFFADRPIAQTKFRELEA